MLYVDCDSHILPDDAFDEVAPEFRAQGPRLVADEKGRRVVHRELRLGEPPRKYFRDWEASRYSRTKYYHEL